MSDGLWEKANKVSEIGYKIDSIAGILELVAERLTDNAESGACWAALEMLREYGEKLETLSTEIMMLNWMADEEIEELKETQPKGRRK